MGKYDDIINLPYNGKQGGLSMYQRAAQFAPFAALTGHGAAILETARLTDTQMDLGDEIIVLLNKRIGTLLNRIKEQPEIIVTYFQPDERKAGGAYMSHTGRVKTIDEYEQNIVMRDGKKIPLQSILYIDGEVFTQES